MVVTPDSLTNTAASIDVTAPTAGPTDGWFLYKLRLCDASTCSAAADCPRAAAATTCPLPALSQNTIYAVWVAAASGSTLSVEGSVTFRTFIS